MVFILSLIYFSFSALLYAHNAMFVQATRSHKLAGRKSIFALLPPSFAITIHSYSSHYAVDNLWHRPMLKQLFTTYYYNFNLKRTIFQYSFRELPQSLPRDNPEDALPGFFSHPRSCYGAASSPVFPCSHRCTHDPFHRREPFFHRARPPPQYRP